MISAREFETTLRALASAPVGQATELAAPDDEMEAWTTDLQGDERDLLRGALGRLTDNPRLLTGDPEGVYTFDDPILALAADFVRRATMAPVGEAADGTKLRNRSWWRWAKAGIRAWVSRGNMAWGALGGRVPTAPIVIEQLPARLALLGDAGYDCAAQQRVLLSIAARHAVSPFNLGVHLGDTYFAGSESETLIHLLKPLSTLPFPFTSLCGNHDLYYGPAGYGATISVLRQPGRYFAIEAPRWRIACLDTALGSERTLRDDGKLDEGQLGWLDGLLAKGDDRRMLLMSHHYIVSDWGDPMPSLYDQLRDRLAGNVLAWYWGHEHNLVAYRKSAQGFFGACVGNGAFLERRHSAQSDTPSAEWVSDGQCTCYPKLTGFWPHGWLELELHDDHLKETYRLEDRDVVYTRTLPRR